jgi:uncharacterized membrane protein YgcG
MESLPMEELRFNYKRVVIAAILGFFLGMLIFTFTSDPTETPVTEFLLKSVYLSGVFSAIALIFSVTGFMVGTLAGNSTHGGGEYGSDSGSGSDGGGYSGGGGDGGGGGGD